MYNEKAMYQLASVSVSVFKVDDRLPRIEYRRPFLKVWQNLVIEAQPETQRIVRSLNRSHLFRNACFLDQKIVRRDPSPRHVLKDLKHIVLHVQDLDVHRARLKGIAEKASAILRPNQSPHPLHSLLWKLKPRRCSYLAPFHSI